MAANIMARQQLELLWQSFIMQSHGNGFNGFSFPQEHLSHIGPGGLREIINRYGALINAPAAAQVSGEMVYIMSAASRVAPPGQQPLPEFATVSLPSGFPTDRLQTLRSKSVSDRKISQHRTKGKAKVPRPPNAFILYRQDNHPKLKAQFPDMHNNDISVRLGNQWKAECEEVKTLYKTKAEEVKQLHLKNNPGYQYQPRKPSERKKRMAKSKTSVLAEEAAAHEYSDSSMDHTLRTGSTVSHESPLPAATPSSSGSPAGSKYMETFPQAFLGGMRQTAYTERGVVPDFGDSDFGMSTYELSTFTYGQDLLGAMVDRFNATRIPSPGPAAATLQNVRASELFASDRLKEHESADQIVDAASQNEASEPSCDDSELYKAMNNSYGTLDFENFFDYDLLESDRNDTLDNEVLSFQQEYLTEDALLASRLLDPTFSAN